MNMIVQLLEYCDKDVFEIYLKIKNNQRITSNDTLILFQKADLASLSYVSDLVRTKINGKNLFYIRNFHIEPSNQCIHNCRFCSFSERISGKGWSYSFDEMIEMVKKLDENIRELHIVGAVNPKYTIDFYGRLLRKIKEIKPTIHIKAFTAVELDYMISASGLTIDEGVEFLKNSGLDSIPGGGAEIFEPEVRRKICSSKTDAEKWLTIHKAAHQAGIPSNATMLYGFFESYEDRVNHMNKIRELQDQTNGFNAFIPLKFKNQNNEFSELNEISVVEEMKNYAISRLFFDNITHLKVYWPMTGIENARFSLHYGVDDFDGTIDDSTKIYEMAGADKNPELSVYQIEKIAMEEGFKATERDALYNIIF